MSMPDGDKYAKARPGGWLPRDPKHVGNWIRKLKRSVVARPRGLVEPIREFLEMVYSDPVLYGNVATMFADAYFREQRTPLGWEPEVKDFEEFLLLLNAIMTTAPECYCAVDPGQVDPKVDPKPAGLVGFPINALLDWPMATTAGYDVFSNALVNQQFKKILNYWSRFLSDPESRYVLVQGDPDEHVIAWLSDTARGWIVAAVNAAVGQGSVGPFTRFDEVFQSVPHDPYYGFSSWDDFFVREFVAGVRPVSDPQDDTVIVNACESAPYALAREVPLSAKFWLKGQPYSLANMLNWDDYTPQFAGGTVYQAFLSALSYHRWHSPVSGTVKKAYLVNGSYYLENLYQSFLENNPDTSAPNNSQGFLTAVATRALIFIEADHPAIGLMCVMPVGMAEVSSCEITVKPGDHVKKGEQLGMFHFGGSTHCLFFRPGVELDFSLYDRPCDPNGDVNIRVNTAIARCIV